VRDAIQASDNRVGDRLLRIISHPIRIEVLRVLQDRPASPKELAAALGESINNVSYHFKYLHLEGCIEIVATESRRGAIEHYYCGKESAADSGVSVRNLVGEAVRALNAGSFDSRADNAVSWTAMRLDEEGWRELRERQAAWVREMEEIKAKAAERLSEDGSTASQVVVGVMCFETPPQR